MYHRHDIGYLTHGDSKGDARGRSKHMSNSKRVARYMEGKNVSTKQGKSFKQVLTCIKDLTIKLPKRHEFPLP